MLQPGAKIETGVDRLLRLIQAKQKISLSDAAKLMSLPVKLVQEWVDFLEDEGLISTEYSLTKSYLIAKKLSQKELNKKENEYEKKRDAFTRRVEVALNQIQDEDKVFEKLRGKYDGLRKTLGSNLTTVEKDIEELHHYEEMKRTFEQQAHQQKTEYQQEVDKLNAQLEHEESRYKEILNNITGEISAIRTESERVVQLGETEQMLRKRVMELHGILQRIINQLSGEESHIDVHKDRLKKLEEMAEQVETKLKDKEKKEIEPFVKLSKDQEEKMLRIQTDIMNKVKERVEQIDKYEHKSEDIAKKFFEFFERRAKTDALLKALGKDEHDMESELKDLMIKAKAYRLANSNSNVGEHLKEMESKLKMFSTEKKKFHSRVDDLNQLITSEKEDAKKLADN
ncbi:hypothetical protein GOV11_03280 [Candidatus Woesearchaeota archaeon]|nr:hypothetical protein [Candidatus Woesearchaeota archaeon]